jgi:hypothetical protein
MIKNKELWESFQKKMLKNEQISLEEALKIMDSLWREGVKLGVLPPKDPLEGIEVDIKVASILNSCLKESLEK